MKIFSSVITLGKKICHFDQENNHTIPRKHRVQLFVQGENVYSVWTDDAPGNSDVFFAKSTGGASFVDHLNISNNNGSSAFPRLVVSEPNVYVVWYDYSPGQSDIFFAQSNDTGKNFRVTHIRSPEPSYNPWVAASSNYVYLVWNDGGRTTTIDLPNGETRIVDVTTGDEEIFFGVSEDDGVTFEFSNLSNSPSQMSWNSRIRASDSNVYVTWNERIGNYSDVFFSASYDNGKTFADPINVSINPQTSMDAGIAISENKIYLIWNQKTPETTDIFYSMSADKGGTFSIPINLSISPTAPQRDDPMNGYDGSDTIRIDICQTAFDFSNEVQEVHDIKIIVENALNRMVPTVIPVPPTPQNP